MPAPNEPESTPFDDADTGEIDDLGMGTEERPSDGEETSDQIDTGGQDWSVTDSPAGEDEWSGGDEGYDEEYEHYVPPDTLPPPYPSGSTLPLFAVLLSLIVTLVLGAALAAASKHLYIPLVYNVVAGVAIGWAVGKAPKWSNFTSGFFLFLLVLICSFLTYAVSHVGCYLMREYQVEDYRYFFEQPWLQQWTDIREYLHARGLRLKAFGYNLGLKWAIAAWSAEVLLTLMVAWLFVRPSIRLSVAEGVPPDVLEMVLNLQQEGFTSGGVRDELKLRGWARRSDQSKALRAAAAYDRLVGNH